MLTLDAMDLPGYPRQAFKRRSPVLPRDPRDRGLAEQIVAGVAKNLRRLETMLGVYSKRRVADVEPRARLICVVGLYQLQFLDRVPDHAVVAEAVAQTRRLDNRVLPRAAGFVNAVLREAIRDPAAGVAALPDWADAAAYCEVALSHPRPIVDRLIALLGKDDAVRFCEHDNRTPPTLVRLIGDATATDLDGDGVAVTPHEQAAMVVVEGARQEDFSRWSAAGLAQPQDATSAAVVPRLDVQAGMTVLDRCCGVGTKTQQLAEAAGSDGRVFAVDASGKRISTLRKLAGGRSTMANVTAKRASWASDFPEDWPTQFDRILIDAPCGNSGVLARRADARYQQEVHDLAAMTALQGQILRDTWPLLKPGGLLAYTTCSVWPEENERIVGAFLAEHPAAEVLSMESTLPSFATTAASHYHDGGFTAILRHADQSG